MGMKSFNPTASSTATFRNSSTPNFALKPPTRSREPVVGDTSTRSIHLYCPARMPQMGIAPFSTNGATEGGIRFCLFTQFLTWTG